MIQGGRIKEFAQRIGREFRAQRVILFGSHAEGRATKNSDVDLFVVMPFRGRRVDQSVTIRLKLRPAFPVDLIVRSPQEVRRRLKMGDTFIRDILDNGEVLYEADHG
jgi:predicted nucleotidyltransferase